MLYEIAQALVRRILRDKILLGLVIIGILGIVMSGMNKEEPSPNQGQPQQSESAQQAASSGAVDPKLATDFVKWWMGGAFDYSAATGAQSHEQAFGWMTNDAVAKFKAAYWTQDTAQSIASGQLVARFQPTSVEAEAVNPDGSVVVGVTGNLTVQVGNQPTSQQMVADFLVTRHRDGLRVADLNNRIAPALAAY